MILENPGSCLGVRNSNIWPEGKAGLKRISHRGMWDEIDSMQFHFMKDQGLLPSSALLEVGCGCFRAGRFFIDHLEFGNYVGVYKELVLIEASKKQELSDELLPNKSPEFIVTDNFDFGQMKFVPDIAIAQSLFSHLTLKDIGLYMQKMTDVCDARTQFYCTFFESDKKLVYFDDSHSGKKLEYTQNQTRRV
ncbi:MAG: hypothetical protein ACI9FB_001385 [Candidatus Azotimanducaceae bacterium]